MSVAFRALPVSGGDAFLITAPAGIYLVDGGVDRNGTLPYMLRQRNITTVTAAICTHTDADHRNGIADLMTGHFPVAEYWLPSSWLDLSHTATLFDGDWEAWTQETRRSRETIERMEDDESDEAESEQQATRCWGEQWALLAERRPNATIRACLGMGAMIIAGLSLSTLSAMDRIGSFVEDSTFIDLSHEFQAHLGEWLLGIHEPENLRYMIEGPIDSFPPSEPSLELAGHFHEMWLLIERFTRPDRRRESYDYLYWWEDLHSEPRFPLIHSSLIQSFTELCADLVCDYISEATGEENGEGLAGLALLLAQSSRIIAAVSTTPALLRFFDYQREIVDYSVGDHPFVCVNGAEVMTPRRMPPTVLADMVMEALNLTRANRESRVFRYDDKSCEVLFCADSNFSFVGRMPDAAGAYRLNTPALITAPHHGALANENVYGIVVSEDESTLSWIRSDGPNTTRPCETYIELRNRFCTTCNGSDPVEVMFSFNPSANGWTTNRSGCVCRRRLESFGF